MCKHIEFLLVILMPLSPTQTHPYLEFILARPRGKLTFFPDSFIDDNRLSQSCVDVIDPLHQHSFEDVIDPLHQHSFEKVGCELTKLSAKNIRFPLGLVKIISKCDFITDLMNLFNQTHPCLNIGEKKSTV